MSSRAGPVEEFPGDHQQVSQQVPLDFARIIGGLEASYSSLVSSYGQLVTGQEKIREYVTTRMDTHQRDDDVHFRSFDDHFREIKQGLGDLRDRITRIESIADMVENHKETIEELEKWRDEQQENKKINESISKNNRRWFFAFLAFMSIVEGDRATGENLTKIIKAMLHLGS